MSAQRRIPLFQILSIITIILTSSCTPAAAGNTSTDSAPVKTAVETSAQKASATPMPTSTATPPPTATPLPMTNVTIDGKFRSGPAETYPVVGSLAAGDEVIVSARNSDSSWYQVNANNVIGWFPSEGLDPAMMQTMAGLPVIQDFPAPPIAITGWNGDPVGKICIDVKPKFSGNYAASHPDEIPSIEPAYMAAASMVVEAGLEPSSDSQCDATLTVETDVLQTGRDYIQNSTNNKMFCYDGVNVNNRVTLTQGTTSLSRTTSKNRTTRRSLSSCESSSEYEMEMQWAVAEGMYKIWGPPMLSAGLASFIEPARNFAVTTIGTLGSKGKSFIPALLDLMQSDPGYIVSAAKSLKSVTGQGFGEDVNAWVEWWLTQDPNYLSSPVGSGSDTNLDGGSSSNPQPDTQVENPTTLTERTPDTSLASVINGTVNGNAAGTEGLIVQLVGYQTRYGFSVVGEVRNDSGAAVDLVSVNIEMYDAAGALLRTDKIYTTPYKIDDKTSGGFEWEYTDITGAASIIATGLNYFPASEYVTSFEVVSSSLARESSMLIMSGQAKNNGNNATISAQVIVYYYDKDDRLIYADSETFYGTDIPAGSLIDYKIYTDEFLPVDHFLVTAECTDSL